MVYEQVVNYICLHTGVITRPGISLKAKLTSDVWEQYNLDVNDEVVHHVDFMTSLDYMLDGGVCTGCNDDVVTCPESE